MRKLEEKSGKDSDARAETADYQKLCLLHGFFIKDVEERNDLGETKLMAAAAEGKCVQLRISFAVHSKSSFAQHDVNISYTICCNF